MASDDAGAEPVKSYDLSEDVYRTVLDALAHAKADAVHTDAENKFRGARVTLLKQHDEQEADDG